jgi:hypothetical protein
VANKITERILESPGWKTLFGAILPIIIGVLSGTFVSEITTNNGLDWASFYKAKSFYGLLIVTVLTFLYHRAAYLYEKQVERFLDEDYCRAYMRSKCLPEAAERYKQLIRSGEFGELTAAMKEFERIMK